MLLFRPWRDVDDAIRTWAGESFARGDINEIWDSIFLHFLAWRRELIDTAWPYFSRRGPATSRPCFQQNSKTWWACMTYPKLLSMELVLSQRRRFTANQQVQILGLPVEEIDHAEMTCASSDNDDDADAASEPAGPDCEQDGSSTLHPPQPPTRTVYPPAIGIRCGTLPSGRRLHDHMAVPCNLGRRSAESYYAEEYLARTQMASVDVTSVYLPRDCVLPASGDSFPREQWSAAALKAKVEMQRLYFESLDCDDLNTHVCKQAANGVDERTSNDPLAAMRKSINAAMASLTAEQSMKQPSHTVVLEAAAYLLGKGLLSVKALERTNVKQGRALLVWASWLQYQRSCDWIAEGKLSREGMLRTPSLLRHLEMILMGAAGSGKTTAVMVQEAILNFFCGEGSTKKSAPTNTAAAGRRGSVAPPDRIETGRSRGPDLGRSAPGRLPPDRGRPPWQ